jgi:putative heme-binding domain-containing protein
LLKAIESRQIDKSWLPIDLVQRTALFSDSNVDQLVKKIWPELQPSTPEELKGEIVRIDSALKAGLGRPKEGFALFERQCSKCHQLFGKGGNVGPDLTSFNRNDINTMLLSVVHPSAEVREGYSTYLVLTMDGRALTGTLAEQDSQTVTLKTADSSVVTIPRADIDEMESSKQSIMPEGLLKSYSEQELRDLFAYLRMSQPLIDR